MAEEEVQAGQEGEQEQGAVAEEVVDAAAVVNQENAPVGDESLFDAKT